MLHPMDRARLCSGSDLTAEKLPYVLRPQNALSVAQRMWSNDFERSKLIRFDPMPRHTRYTQRLPFPSSLENAIRTGRLILMLDDARMITAPVVSQRNGELQTSGLERESLLFRTTIERALNRSNFSSGRINPADQPKTAPMSFADSIAVNNKYLLSEGKKAKDKEYVVDLQCVWDNGQSVGEIPIQLTFDNGVVQRYMLPANGHLQVTGVSSLFYKAQLKPDLDNTELSALRTSIQKTLTAIIEKEKAQAAIHQSLQDQMGVVDNVRVHTGAVMWGIWNLAKDSVVAVKEWSDVINPVVAYNNALQAAYVARQAGPESDWSETFRETYNDLQHREWVEALGFDPSKITMAQLAEAYEFANFVYEDPPTQKMLTKFGREYIAAQDSVEFAESVAPTVIVTILGAILTATTLGAGGAVVAGRVAKEFADLGKLLIDLGKALKKAKLSERIFSKMSNKLEKLEIRRPKAQKVAEPKRVDGNRNDGTMRGGSVVPDTKTIVSSEMEEKILYGQRALNGQGNPSNRLIGAHSGQISNANERFALETLSVNADGTRNVKLITQFEDGNVSRIKSSTLFPESWSDADVMSAVNHTGSTTPLAIRASDGASLYQSTVNGVKVEVIKVGDNVTAAYPCGRGCTDPSAFGG
ncbi:EndoU domain-containing protein [Amphritea pacifica]|uniref:EndoU domain-containing protein n=1 Tax=Amphritea pacifica TaxID=2811233 RepID=A0ABS2WDH8_9GAMM|nr:EndoU domain-containing protein [Amphritea pacifica]MBN0989738.1 EndoU domain-containing protein [Amphritea pacifica]MBN1007407.1 EndoU domain-containing protein [Amphritea pacifica]